MPILYWVHYIIISTTVNLIQLAKPIGVQKKAKQGSNRPQVTILNGETLNIDTILQVWEK